MSAADRVDLLQGTLDLLILQTLRSGAAHGHEIMQAIERRSGSVLHVEQGSLYPALHRLIKRGWITFDHGTSENNRRAKYYTITRAGQRHLAREAEQWEQTGRIVAWFLTPEPT